LINAKGKVFNLPAVKNRQQGLLIQST